MNQTRLLAIIASLVACAPNGLSAETLSAETLSAETVYPPAPNATSKMARYFSSACDNSAVRAVTCSSRCSRY